MKQDKIKIFLADDDDDDLFFFKSALKNLEDKIELTTVINGEQVINYFKSESVLPDFIFLDINMPKTNGIDCLKFIKEMYPDTCPPVIMLSTASSEKIINLTKSSGADLYIEKPHNLSDLTLYIDYCLYKLKNTVSAEFLLNKRLLHI